MVEYALIGGDCYVEMHVVWKDTRSMEKI